VADSFQQINETSGSINGGGGEFLDQLTLLDSQEGLHSVKLGGGGGRTESWRNIHDEFCNLYFVSIILGLSNRGD
jgi:hypothetical protein